MYDVTVNNNLRLDDIAAGQLVAQVLQNDFEFISREILDLQRRRELKSYEAEDLASNIKIRDAMRTLLSYYMTYRDYTEFMELQRVYGNVE